MKKITPSIAILKMGDLDKYSHPDYDEVMITGMKITADHFLTYDIPSGDILPDPSDIDAVVISGSSLMLTDDHPWMDQVTAWIREVSTSNIPILGICFGHQLLASALGGKVGYNPAGIELGTYNIEVGHDGRSDELLAEYYPRFKAHVSHVQSVLELPENTVVLASSKLEPFQAFRIGNNIWGVQFHPEFDRDLMEKIVIRKADDGIFNFDMKNILDSLENTEKSYDLLRKFGAIINSRSNLSTQTNR